MIFGSAVILAGGKSSRMGFDKQSIETGGVSLVKMLIESLSRIFYEIVVVTNKPELYKDFEVIVTSDEFDDAGPLAGIHAGLKASSSDYVYFVACDMTCISFPYIDFLKNMLIEELNIVEGSSAVDFNPDGIFTRYNGECVETFQAFYSKRLIGAVEESIKSDNKSANKFISGINSIIVERRLVETEFGNNIFENLNNTDDLEKYRVRINREKN